jgi:hypothetical protein
MSYTEKSKENKPKKGTSSSDISTSPSGNACICKPQQRNISCLIHGSI